MINCFMSATKPGVWENINRGAYLAIVNEETCAVTEQASSSSSGGSGAAGMSGGAAAGSGQSSGAGQATISLKTFGVNSTQPDGRQPRAAVLGEDGDDDSGPAVVGRRATGTATPQRHLQEMHLREMKKGGCSRRRQTHAGGCRTWKWSTTSFGAPPSRGSV